MGRVERPQPLANVVHRPDPLDVTADAVLAQHLGGVQGVDPQTDVRVVRVVRLEVTVEDDYVRGFLAVI